MIDSIDYRYKNNISGEMNFNEQYGLELLFISVFNNI